MDRYPPGSRTSRHAGPRCCNHPHVTIEPAAGYLGSYPLDDAAIAPDSAQTLPARNRQPQPDRQPLFLKTRSSHFSFMLFTARQTTMKSSGSWRHMSKTRAKQRYSVCLTNRDQCHVVPVLSKRGTPETVFAFSPPQLDGLDTLLFELLAGSGNKQRPDTISLDESALSKENG